MVKTGASGREKGGISQRDRGHRAGSGFGERVRSENKGELIEVITY